jgi:hypothetical protein
MCYDIISLTQKYKKNPAVEFQSKQTPENILVPKELDSSSSLKDTCIGQGSVETMIV